jgi:hypothetical protein
MAARRIDPRAVKLNRCYDIAELAAQLRVHKNTVRHWQRDGLVPLDGGRPVLFHGSVVRTFLETRNAKRKSPCPPGTMYCFRCRAPRKPALSMIEFIPLNATSGNIRALCGTCEATMHRRAPFASLAAIMPRCDIQLAEGPARLIGSPSPSLICELRQEATTR